MAVQTRRFGAHVAVTVTIVALFRIASSDCRAFGGALRLSTHTLDLILARLSPLRLLASTSDEARVAGIMHGALERTGATIGRADPMIAATALVQDLTLVTGNVNHY